jgi:hypothetical protein
MSGSYHATFLQLKGNTKSQLNEMAEDVDSILGELVIKLQTKKKVKTERKQLKVKNELIDNKVI